MNRTKILGKKGEYHITDLLVGGLIVAIYMSCLFTLWIGMNDHYGVSGPSSDFNAYSAGITTIHNNVTAPISNSYTSVGSGDVSSSTSFYSEGQIKVGWDSLKILLNTPIIIGKMVLQSTNITSGQYGLGIPGAATDGAIAILGVIVVASLVALYYRRLP